LNDTNRRTSFDDDLAVEVHQQEQTQEELTSKHLRLFSCEIDDFILTGHSFDVTQSLSHWIVVLWHSLPNANQNNSLRSALQEIIPPKALATIFQTCRPWLTQNHGNTVQINVELPFKLYLQYQTQSDREDILNYCAWGFIDLMAVSGESADRQIAVPIVGV
jgi:hypothetical protein